MSFRVALLGIYHESNTFIQSPTELKDFRDGHWLWGEAIRSEYSQAHHEIGGMLEVMDQSHVEVVPIMFAEATPGGIVTADAYEELLAGMLAGLKKELPLDGCLVVPHGAGVSEHYRDMDGHWIEAVRRLLGPQIPIIGTLDLHANLSQRMIDSSDALIAYKQNPHLDQRERGKEAAALLLQTMQGVVTPTQHLVQLPSVIGIEQQWTDESPSKDIYDYAHRCESSQDILSVSVTLGFPYADVEEMGTAIIVIGNNNIERAAEIANKMKTFILDLQPLFIGEKTDVSHIIQMLPGLPKPVLLLDMGDNIGGGTSGRGLTLAKALEADGRFRYFSYQPDASAITKLKKNQVGDDCILTLSGFDEEQKDECWDVPVTITNRVDGQFVEDTPQHGGQVRFDMGETLICTTAAGGVLMVSTLRIPPFSSKQMTSFGLDPTSFDVIVAKGVNAPIAAYGSSCQSIKKVDTPGESRAEITQLNYQHRRVPMFPFEQAADGN